jgi:hypothetical protein
MRLTKQEAYQLRIKIKEFCLQVLKQRVGQIPDYLTLQEVIKAVKCTEGFARSTLKDLVETDVLELEYSSNIYMYLLKHSTPSNTILAATVRIEQALIVTRKQLEQLDQEFQTIKSHLNKSNVS